jgi:hypothetical protein
VEQPKATTINNTSRSRRRIKQTTNKRFRFEHCGQSDKIVVLKSELASDVQNTRQP